MNPENNVLPSITVKSCRNKDCTQLNPQPIENFGKDKSKKDGHCTRCMACDRAYRELNYSRLKANYKVYYQLNSDKRKLTARNWHYLNVYGLTFEQKQQMSEVQGHKCANINCSYMFKSISEACVDHNHTTSKVRALLCHPCNKALGLLKENFERTIGLAKYIQDHEGII
jgi:hypothetical protein